MRLDLLDDLVGSRNRFVCRVIVQVDPRYFRPAEVNTLLGDASRAKAMLGWEPEVSFDALVCEMVAEDLRLAQRDELVKRHGHTIPKPTEE